MLRAGSAIGGTLKTDWKNESDVHVDLTRKQGVVQSKVIAINMLIQNDYSRSRGPKISVFLAPMRRPN
jgi:hypothetical protein